MSLYRPQTDISYTGRVLVDDSDHYWVVVADVNDDRIVVTDEKGRSFVIRGEHGRGPCLVEGLHRWTSHPINKDGSYAGWLRGTDTKKEYIDMLLRIDEAKQRYKEAREKEAQESEKRMLMRKKNTPDIESHVTIPGMWYCLVVDQHKKVEQGTYYNPQYIREITPLDLTDYYEFKLAGSAYVTVKTKFN